MNLLHKWIFCDCFIVHIFLILTLLCISYTRKYKYYISYYKPASIFTYNGDCLHSGCFIEAHLLGRQILRILNAVFYSVNLYYLFHSTAQHSSHIFLVFPTKLSNVMAVHEHNNVIYNIPYLWLLFVNISEINFNGVCNGICSVLILCIPVGLHICQTLPGIGLEFVTYKVHII
jgi:hypothetical protein